MITIQALALWMEKQLAADKTKNVTFIVQTKSRLDNKTSAKHLCDPCNKVAQVFSAGYFLQIVIHYMMKIVVTESSTLHILGNMIGLLFDTFDLTFSILLDRFEWDNLVFN